MSLLRDIIENIEVASFTKTIKVSPWDYKFYPSTSELVLNYKKKTFMTLTSYDTEGVVHIANGDFTFNPTKLKDMICKKISEFIASNVYELSGWREKDTKEKELAYLLNVEGRESDLLCEAYIKGSSKLYEQVKNTI